MRTFWDSELFNKEFWDAYMSHYLEFGFIEGFDIGLDMYCNFGGI